MEPLSLPLLAQMIAADFRRASAAPLGDEMQRDLANRIETGLRTALQHQRDAFAAQCQARVELWTRTGERAGLPDAAGTEARARANEAAYLLDAVRASS